MKNIVLPNAVKPDKPDLVQPMYNNPLPANERPEEIRTTMVDKLPIEPDKQKLNIFKKISSKPKEDKEKDFHLEPPQHKPKEFDNPPVAVVVDDGVNERHARNNDLAVKHQEEKRPMVVPNHVVNNHVVRSASVPEPTPNCVPTSMMMSPGSDMYTMESPPGTPISTPKTPEFSVPIAAMEQQQKKKKKDKSGKKREPKIKTPKNPMHPKKVREMPVFVLFF